MWRNDVQRGAVARALLASVRLEDLWDASGPTDLAVAYHETGGGPLSSGQVLFLRLAFDCWNGSGGASVGELLDTLDSARLSMVADLLRASAEGPDAIDRWLDERGGR